ncbi:MAG TPA: 2-hydroxy-6-oxo-6-phenylhexa-2,4-dienoate hydrolase [Anaerolineae bacterium]|nr:2-hydroxy-6-oxo-6-phenylhexa-2,4-dienoate hydrolase [Anaerolineae bacterium]
MECVLENITVHYETFGEGDPIVILPGWGIPARLMEHLVEPSFQDRNGWQRIYIDPPGHGKTAGKDSIKNQDQILDVVLAAVDKITEGKNYSLLGLSLGAYLARGIVLKRPERVTGIAMIVPVIFAEDNRRTVPPHEVIVEESMDGIQLTKMEEFIWSMSVVHTRKWLEEIRAFPESSDGENGNAEFLNQIRTDPAKYAFSFDVDALPAPFERPSLIVTGRQDSSVGYVDAFSLLKNYPRASYAVLDRMGHLSEDSQETIGFLMNIWLDRVEESNKNR